MIDNIQHNGELLAIIVRRDFDGEGTSFLTPKENALQIGVIKRDKNTLIKPHIHKPLTRAIASTQEVLFIQKGKIRVDFYEKNGQRITDRILNEGDMIALISKGHGFTMLEDTKMVEVKQGPYVSVEMDKEFIEVKE
jgi:cupin fold WbuC family metalloprotein